MALDAIKTIVETVQTITPKMPAVDMPFATSCRSRPISWPAVTTSPSSCSPTSASSPTRWSTTPAAARQGRQQVTKKTLGLAKEEARTMGTTPRRTCRTNAEHGPKSQIRRRRDQDLGRDRRVHHPQCPAMDYAVRRQLPKPADVVASAYDFAEQLLQSQRKFAEEVLNATSSLTPGTENRPASNSTHPRYAAARKPGLPRTILSTRPEEAMKGPVGSTARSPRLLHQGAAQGADLSSASSPR